MAKTQPYLSFTSAEGISIFTVFKILAFLMFLVLA